METTLATTFFGNPSASLQTGSQGTADTGKDPQLFLNVLKQTMKGKAEVVHGGTTQEKSATETKTSSTDDLAKSLDIIDALAFLPVLLAAQAQTTAAVDTSGETQAYSSETISNLLEAITRALETGNTLDVQKTLEGDQSLQTLLSGQTQTASKGLSSTSGASSLAALLMSTDTSGNASGETATDALASMLAAMLAGGTKSTTATGGEKSASSTEGEEKKETAASQPAEATDDVVRNTMLLGAVLPNLLSVKSGATPSETGTAQSEGKEAGTGTIELGADLVEAAAARGTAAKNNSASTRTENSSASANQDSTKTGLSEDYVLLNGSTKNQDGEEASGKAFEAIFKTARTAKGAATATEAEVISPLASASEKVTNDEGAASDRDIDLKIVGAKARRAEAREHGRPGMVMESASSADEGASDATILVESTDAVTAAVEKSSQVHHDKGGTKATHEESKTESTAKKNDHVTFTADNQTSVTQTHAKEQAASAAKGSYVTTMVSKIEELAATYSGKTQAMDMTLRLNIDDKESILVGLKEQGNKVVVEVKAASESVMNTLQLHKDAITRELEAKNIYATIHVDSDAQEKARNFSEQKGRQSRSANKGTEEEFGGILDTLA